MKVKITYSQLIVIVNLMGEQISHQVVREAVKEMRIEQYIFLHNLSEVVRKLGKKSYDFRADYTMKMTPPHAAALMLGCYIATNEPQEPYNLNTLRMVINQIEAHL